MDLSELRLQLDELDQRIVDIYEERMKICAQVAEYKLLTGKKVLDKEREQQKIESVCALVHNDADRIGVRELFEQIMAMSRKLQYQVLVENGAISKLPFIEKEDLFSGEHKVVFQGAQGAYSQIAMQNFFGKDVSCFAVDTFRDAMGAIEEGRADFAVLPIENSTAGVVSEIYDLLVEYENYIVGEQVVKIEHCLLGLPEAKISDIRTVYSHPQSLMQTSHYLCEHPKWSQIGMQNNAFAAKKVLEEHDLSQAAIASAYAGELYGLKVLQSRISNDVSNSTRFIIITNQKLFQSKATKISICFEIHHESGALYHALSHFIYNQLNLCKIESRPIENRNWEYRFFVDFEGNLLQSNVMNALRGLREETINMKILGNY